MVGGIMARQLGDIAGNPPRASSGELLQACSDRRALI
jgi:hypothetical protein